MTELRYEHPAGELMDLVPAGEIVYEAFLAGLKGDIERRRRLLRYVAEVVLIRAQKEASTTRDIEVGPRG